MTLTQDIEPRTYFRTFEAALADFKPPAENIDQIIDVVRTLSYEHVYIPESRAFIALEPAGSTTPVAFIAHGYIAVHPQEGDNYWIELPAHQAAAKGFAAVAKQVEEAVIPTCATCFTNLPSTGTCDYCD
ncbi:hypothetical protein [Demequina rhizosphaerae]|uniref:hypothetical protein n=1 Tax=Demequina rhizosphaerae TaxID=1638985 RepID=UPI000A807FB7|nr:hypothetical protein [Demequina rhizosphaerae]